MSTTTSPRDPVAAEVASLRVAWLILGDRATAEALVADALAAGGAHDLVARVRRRAVVARSRGGPAAPHEALWTSTRRLPRRSRAGVAQRLFTPLTPAA